MDSGCFNCKYFVWWDGDYCCLGNDWKILIPSKEGELDAEIRDKMIEMASRCRDYVYDENINNIYNGIFNETGCKENEG